MAIQRLVASAGQTAGGETGSKMSNGPKLEASEGIDLKIDRRRPGRIANLSPELIPLLRGELPDPDQQFGNPDQLHGARGIAAGVAIGATLWAAIGYAAYCIF